MAKTNAPTGTGRSASPIDGDAGGIEPPQADTPDQAGPFGGPSWIRILLYIAGILGGVGGGLGGLAEFMDSDTWQSIIEYLQSIF